VAKDEKGDGNVEEEHHGYLQSGLRLIASENANALRVLLKMITNLTSKSVFMQKKS